MTVPQPIVYLDFVNSLFWDPRVSFTRAGTATYFDTQGILKTRAANIPRWESVPSTGVRRGVLMEKQITNLILTSENLGSASWTKTNVSILTGATSPDGSSASNQISVTGASGSVTQSITITAGRAIAFSVHAKSTASSNYLFLRIGDGTNSVSTWFDVSSGTVGTNTAGASTCVFSAKNIEPLVSGWYRCSLTVTTSTSTLFTCEVSAAAGDNTSPASGNAVDVWGAQAEAPSTQCAPTSYIPTTSAPVQREADNAFLPIESRWYNLSEGTMLFEYSNLLNPPSSGSASYVLGGVANTFDNTIYLTLGPTSVTATFGSGGVGSGALTVSGVNRSLNTVNRVGVSWAAGSGILVVDGGTAASGSRIPPLSVARFGLGMSPWGTTDNTNVAAVAFRRFMYFDRQLSASTLQTLTS